MGNENPNCENHEQHDHACSVGSVLIAPLVLRSYSTRGT